MQHGTWVRNRHTGVRGRIYNMYPYTHFNYADEQLRMMEPFVGPGYMRFVNSEWISWIGETGYIQWAPTDLLDVIEPFTVSTGSESYYLRELIQG